MGRFLRAAIFVLFGVVFMHIKEATEPPPFKTVATGAYRLTQPWYLIPGVPPTMPTAAGLVNVGEGRWLLIDAGCKNNSRQSHARHLVGMLKATIPEGEQLVAIALTHGHADHVGALPLLLAAYPDVPVLVHKEELPFLTENLSYFLEFSAVKEMFRYIGLDWAEGLQLPKSRVRVLEGASGDLAEWGAPNVQFIHTPGHTPGHVVFLHKDSGVLYAGDVVSFIFPELRRESAGTNEQKEQWEGRISRGYPLLHLTLRAGPSFLCYPPYCDRPQAADSLCRIVAKEIDFTRIVPGHDHGSGSLTKRQLVELTAGIPMCQPGWGHYTEEE